MKKAKRLICLLLALILCCGLCACGSGDSNKGDISVGDGIVIKSCRFAKEVRGYDNEYASTSFTEREKSIFVDVLIEIFGNEKEYTKNDFSGFVLYEEVEESLQYAYGSWSGTGVGEEKVPAKEGGYVHLFTLIPKEARTRTDLKANVTIAGKEFELAVEPEAETPADLLSEKTKLTKGSKETTYNGKVEFEVLDFKYADYIHPTGDEEYEFKPMNSNNAMFEAVLKLTNNMELPIEFINTYTIINSEAFRGEAMLETENNTKFENVTKDHPIAAGATETVHVYVVVDKNVKQEDIVLRFNLGGNCYYVPAVQ